MGILVKNGLRYRKLSVKQTTILRADDNVQVPHIINEIMIVKVTVWVNIAWKEVMPGTMKY